MNLKASKYTVREKGFTIVELLIVIVVIGILAGLVTNAYASTQRQAKVAQAQSDLSTIKKAMLAYKIELGELPPAGDFWNYGSIPPAAEDWRPVLEDMETNGYLANGRLDVLLRDPWGHAYGYDDNDCNSWAGENDHTYVQSFGPNGQDDEPGDAGNDDVTVQITRGCNY